MPSIDALTGALNQFQGTLIFISHDVYFIRAIANHVVHVNAGRLTHFPGGYQYYLDKTAAVSARAGLTAGQSKAAARIDPAVRPSVKLKDQKRREAEQRQTRSRAAKEQQQVVHRLEKQIQALELKQTDLAAQLEKPETYEKSGRAMQINRELSEVTTELDRLIPEWENAAMKLIEVEN